MWTQKKKKKNMAWHGKKHAQNTFWSVFETLNGSNEWYLTGVLFFKGIRDEGKEMDHSKEMYGNFKKHQIFHKKNKIFVSCVCCLCSFFVCYIFKVASTKITDNISKAKHIYGYNHSKSIYTTNN